MSHWASIDENNKVTGVIVCDNDDPNGDEGFTWLMQTFGGQWVQTSYNGNIRKNYAGIGYTYDKERDAFIAPKPFESWILNEETCKWEAPVARPSDPFKNIWDEENQEWVSTVN